MVTDQEGVASMQLIRDYYPVSWDKFHRTYRGKFMVIYFGYTFCPDVCPTELTIIADALDKIGPLANRQQQLQAIAAQLSQALHQQAQQAGQASSQTTLPSTPSGELDPAAAAVIMRVCVFHGAGSPVS